MAPTSSTGTRKPFSPSRISSRGPPQGQSVEMQARPRDIASIRALGMPSVFEGSTKIPAFSILSGMSETEPWKTVFFSAPRSFARCFSCSSSPAP